MPSGDGLMLTMVQPAAFAHGSTTSATFAWARLDIGERLRDRGERNGDNDHQQHDRHDRALPAEIARLAARFGCVPVHTVERHDDDAAREDGRDVRDEEQQRAQRLIVLPRLEREADNRQRRDERDGDRYTRQGVGDVGAGQRDRSDRARRERREKIDESRSNASRDLRVRRRNHFVRHQPADEPADRERPRPRPSRRNRIDRPRLDRSANATASTIPRIGVMSGATIIAPITVAVESAVTPAAAITAARTSSTQNRLTRRGRSGPSKNNWSRIRAISVAVTDSTAFILDQYRRGLSDPLRSTQACALPRPPAGALSSRASADRALRRTPWALRP